MGIRDRILARQDLAGMRAARDITGLAAALNSEVPPAMVVQQHFVTARGILTTCADGEGILAALEAAKASTSVRWALEFLGQEAGLDIGDPTIYPLLDKLVAGAVLTQVQIDALKAMALAPLLVTQEQVALEFFNPDGSEK